MAVTKIKPIKSTLSKALDYIQNPDKTEGKTLVSSFAVSYTHLDVYKRQDVLNRTAKPVSAGSVRALWLNDMVFHAKRKSSDKASEPSKSKRKGCSTDRSDQPFRIRELKELVLSHCTPFY